MNIALFQVKLIVSIINYLCQSAVSICFAELSCYDGVSLYHLTTFVYRYDDSSGSTVQLERVVIQKFQNAKSKIIKHDRCSNQLFQSCFVQQVDVNKILVSTCRTDFALNFSKKNFGDEWDWGCKTLSGRCHAWLPTRVSLRFFFRYTEHAPLVTNIKRGCSVRQMS